MSVRARLEATAKVDKRKRSTPLHTPQNKKGRTVCGSIFPLSKPTSKNQHGPSCSFPSFSSVPISVGCLRVVCVLASVALYIHMQVSVCSDRSWSQSLLLLISLSLASIYHLLINQNQCLAIFCKKASLDATSLLPPLAKKE